MVELQNRTYLALDYGRRRIGVAKSDPTGSIATAVETLTVKSEQEAVRKVLKLIEDFRPAGLVVGYPLLDSGEPSDMCREIEQFLDKLTAEYSGPIFRVDESGSSLEAASIVHEHGKRAGRKKDRLDRLAAVLILERFLKEGHIR